MQSFPQLIFLPAINAHYLFIIYKSDKRKHSLPRAIIVVWKFIVKKSTISFCSSLEKVLLRIQNYTVLLFEQQGTQSASPPQKGKLWHVFIVPGWHRVNCHKVQTVIKRNYYCPLYMKLYCKFIIWEVNIFWGLKRIKVIISSCCLFHKLPLLHKNLLITQPVISTVNYTVY